MDPLKIQELVLDYKATRSNKTFKVILSEYEAIITKLIKPYTHSQQDMALGRHLASIQIFYAIESYEPVTARFVTLCYAYLAATPRLLLKELNLNTSDHVLDMYESDHVITELWLDIKAILSVEELLILTNYMNKYMAESNATRAINAKLTKYIARE